MKRQYIFLMSAIATMMTLTSCDTLLAIDSTPAGTVYTSGGTIYTSVGTIYNAGYGSGYDGRHSERRDMSGYRIHRQVTEFGEHVRGWRMVLGLTAQQVSERAGITRDTLRKIESGNPNVSFNSVTQVLRALGILDQLVDAADPLASDIGRLRAGRLTRKRAR